MNSTPRSRILLIGVFHQREVELCREKFYRLIVIANDERNVHDRLFHRRVDFISTLTICSVTLPTFSTVCGVSAVPHKACGSFRLKSVSRVSSMTSPASFLRTKWLHVLT
jgi:hypothetical protein